MEKDPRVPTDHGESYVANSTDDEGEGLGGLPMMGAAGGAAVDPPP